MGILTKRKIYLYSITCSYLVGLRTYICRHVGQEIAISLID